MFYMMGFVWPSANIVITTDTEDLPTNIEFTASTSANSVSPQDKIVPATEVETKKEDSEKANATGEKDVGDKAKGEISITSQQCSSILPPPAIAAGSTVTANGVSFVTNAAASFNATDVEISGGCLYFSSNTVQITAAKAGTNGNISNGTFKVSGRSDATGQGSTSGGTTKVATVVSQQDVDNAKAKLDTNEDSISGELEKQLQDQGYMPIKETLAKSNEKTNVNPAVGTEAGEVTVSYSATYTMLGVKADDLTQVVSASVQSDIDPERQQVQDAGLDQASYKVKKDGGNGTVISMSTIVAIGPKIDTDTLKTEIAGKKKGETQEIVRQLPGVNDVAVEYSPFWVNKTPKNPSKVTIEFKDVAQ